MWTGHLGPATCECAPTVGEEIGLRRETGDANIVITGEGRYDSQSAAGKVPWYVRGVAQSSGSRCLLGAGFIAAASNEFDRGISLSALAGSSKAAMAGPHECPNIAGQELASSALRPI
ncbi:glycerate kinase [Arthrobacter nitrophenolicus]|uniref:Uncharacterized protein n=1 Tax=Arthrobacter nitrophenolicus TaxID=683150 RepID=A0A4R5XSJ0_9MICC|nr:hypothetical protein E2R57_15650 [Arthrobacter nitrophenolicus]